MALRRLVEVLLVPISLAGGIASIPPDNSPPDGRTDAPIANGQFEATLSSGDAPSAGSESGDPLVGERERDVDAVRRRLLGDWQDDYQGRRTMTLNGDGTGTMRVELRGAQAFLVAPKLRFDMEWSFDGTKLTKKTTGGEPAGKVGLILRTMGDTAADILLEITDDRLLLLDADGRTRYDWRRP